MQKFVVLLILLFIPFASAIEIGGFEVENGKIVGKYLPAGLEGKISCYSNGKHILDIIYKNDSIELSIKYFGSLEKILERNPFLKEELEKSLVSLNISGAGYKIGYENCIVELHDVPTRFLRIKADEIIFSDLNYNISKDENIVKLSKDNFTGMIFSDEEITINEKEIIAHKEIIFISFAYKEERKIEDAIKNRLLGGEITIVGYDPKKSADNISYFGNVHIYPLKLEKGKIVLGVSGDEKAGGKIIKINLGKKVCLSDDFQIKFDDRVVKEASSLDDILNPDDDGLNPEYYVLATKQEGIILLISVPHFSNHILSIEFFVEDLIAKAAAIFFGIIIVILAAFYLFKK